jgi:GNAT superfamily N-acetyltransferase
MVRPHLNSVPDALFPTGIGARPLQDCDGGLWTEIIRRSEVFGVIRDGLYEREFGFDAQAARERVYFATDAAGAAVATVGAWYGTDDFDRWGRIHWLYVLPDWQGQGLGRALLTFALHRLAELGHDRAYLTTSTGRPAAIRLYLRYGFVPDLTFEDTEETWKGFLPSIDRPLR